jgi:Golgi phosphoprotein 3 (GPP34)
MDRPRLAADFFLIAHDEFSGKLRISPDLLGWGLVGAQLAELVMANRVVVESGRVLVTDARGDGTDEVGAYVAEGILHQDTTHTVRIWVDTFRDVLPELVARRLVTEGVVRREQGGRQLMRRRPDRYPATDLLAAARPRLRLEHMLRTPQEFDLSGAVLAVLVGTLGVESVLDPGLDRSTARDLMTRLEDNLPADLRALIEGVRSAVAAVSLTIRR